MDRRAILSTASALVTSVLAGCLAGDEVDPIPEDAETQHVAVIQDWTGGDRVGELGVTIPGRFFPWTVVVQAGIPVQMYFTELRGREHLNELSLDPFIDGAEVLPGDLNSAEFVPRSAGEWAIRNLGHDEMVEDGEFVALDSLQEVWEARIRDGVHELALIHSIEHEQIFPPEVTIHKDVPVRFLSTSLAESHPPDQDQPGVTILDADTGESVWLEEEFTVTPRQISITEFVPDRTGEFIITHEAHGHPIQASLRVIEVVSDVDELLRPQAGFGDRHGDVIPALTEVRGTVEEVNVQANMILVRTEDGGIERFRVSTDDGSTHVLIAGAMGDLTGIGPGDEILGYHPADGSTLRTIEVQSRDGALACLWRDDVLEATYWLLDEGLAEAATPGVLRGFVPLPDGIVAAALTELEDGLYVIETENGYVLTDRGREVAEMRFTADTSLTQTSDFSPMVCGPGCLCPNTEPHTH